MSGTDKHRLAPSAPRAEADDDDELDGAESTVTSYRDIHPTPTPESPPLRQQSWEDAASHMSLSSSAADDGQFSTMSREFTAMVATAGAGARADDVVNPCDDDDDDHRHHQNHQHQQLARIGEHEADVETNPLALAIVPESNPGVPAPAPVAQVRKEEVEAKVAAWQAEEVAKINNKFKREEVVINGWESQEIHKANAALSKVERRLEEERAKATEKARNEVAKARRKAEEKRATAEARRGTKSAKVLELAGFMKAVGRVPTKRSFFSF